MKVMAVDYGDARTGIALSDPSGFLASPVCVIHETDETQILAKTAEQVARTGAERVVVGLPKNMNGTLGPRAEKAQAFAKALEAACGVPVLLFDERRTTLTAQVYFNATNTRGKKRKNSIDAAAATIILQDYLDSVRNTPNGKA
ncbi:Holliday junction resolvase RuvX [Ethanoligenens harbinense]|uniref:Putative pre-16S rRNA nuclease n=1 Tax=Ethanoligenens harbinense (strain DSM 18485 / JCM 12961 / CGMCC 1.5033 / YUAN-3) TaxID=663278 RepID=E6U5E5_ETHHY|nr:Holliday junction resolvase RuvX [Ethanoligenens harbinense]ADU25612.1 Holliday junction resolvase YqgF [Ethanoligenens harbinense YUAN-3]AVQ94789.1 Holliday junction resolvase RuvX [Ethanoligenens harbinense YUAN-3]AYF37480.1 Holliday junction resolvase RuvX [Ethanoligenens harbinense]AYF40200.1 Holliday junction resolvase RuvX [Ethanoligenens harbinense]QCN91035.1 Holliday junction resolvase RuvX [Ethanoligenens harbinense]